MSNRNRIDVKWIDSNGYRELSGKAYKYVLHANGYEVAKYTNKADAIAEARYIWANPSAWRALNGVALNDVEVVWIGNPDTHAVWTSSPLAVTGIHLEMPEDFGR